MKRLEQWRRDYDGLLSRLRQREGEAVSLRHQLTNIQAERRRWEAAAARRLKESQLEARRSLLAEARRRARDRKETEALERQVALLETRLRNMRQNRGEARERRESRGEARKVMTKEEGVSESLRRQVAGILRSEQASRRVRRELVAMKLPPNL